MATRAVKMQILGINPDGELFLTAFTGVGTDADNINTLATNYATHVSAAWTSSALKNRCGRDFHITGVKITRFVIATGVVEDTASAALALDGLGGNAMPSQVALVASLGTSLAGRSGKGRMFWGGIQSSEVTSPGRVTAITQGDLLDFVKTLFTAVAADAVPQTPSVYSVKLRQTHPVNVIRVGDSYDVQRRRANRRAESYSSVAFP